MGPLVHVAFHCNPLHANSIEASLETCLQQDRDRVSWTTIIISFDTGVKVKHDTTALLHPFQCFNISNWNATCHTCCKSSRLSDARPSLQIAMSMWWSSKTDCSNLCLLVEKSILLAKCHCNHSALSSDVGINWQQQDFKETCRGAFGWSNRHKATCTIPNLNEVSLKIRLKSQCCLEVFGRSRCLLVSTVLHALFWLSKHCHFTFCALHIPGSLNNMYVWLYLSPTWSRTTFETCVPTQMLVSWRQCHTWWPVGSHEFTDCRLSLFAAAATDLETELRAEVATYRAATFVDSTVKTYNVHRKSYFHSWILRSTLRGIEHLKACEVSRKPPTMPQILLPIKVALDLVTPFDAVFWSVCLVLFFGTFSRGHSTHLPFRQWQILSWYG